MHSASSISLCVKFGRQRICQLMFTSLDLLLTSLAIERFGYSLFSFFAWSHSGYSPSSYSLQLVSQPPARLQTSGAPSAWHSSDALPVALPYSLSYSLSHMLSYSLSHMLSHSLCRIRCLSPTRTFGASSISVRTMLVVN